MKLTVFAAFAAVAAHPAQAAAGDVLVRGRAIIVAPQESSSAVQPSFPGEKVSVSDRLAPEVDVTYMITDHFGLELIAATTKHSVHGRSGTLDSIGRLASTWVLPPTLTAQYHFAPGGRVRPYVGAGLNYTIFYAEKASTDLEDAVGDTDVHLSDSFGPSVQAGVDIDVAANLFVNFDIKWIDMDTKARLKTGAIGTQDVKVHIDPIVAGIGLGMRF